MRQNPMLLISAKKLGYLTLSLMTVLSIQAQTVYFTETFNTVIPGTIPAGWQLGDGGVIDQQPPLQPDSTWSVITDFNGNDLGQGKFLFIQGNSTIGQKDTIETPAITILPGSLTGELYVGFLTFSVEWHVPKGGHHPLTQVPT